MKAPVGPILGISALDKDATAALYRNGTWNVVAEERLSRVKLHAGFPSRSIAAPLEGAALHPDDLHHVVYSFMAWWVEGARIVSGYARDLPFALTNGTSWPSRLRHLQSYGAWCSGAIRNHRRDYGDLIRELRSMGLAGKLTSIDHHASHAAAAYLTSGFDQAVALTLDWYGGGLSGSVNLCTPAGIQRLHDIRYPHSLGLFYAQVTSGLGFTTSQHEGKIVGLAAYGDSSILGPALLARFVRKDGSFRYRSGMDQRFFHELAERSRREDVAAAYQHVLEVIAGDLAAYWIRETGVHDVALAGGVAANVKMNQRIAELESVQRVFIHPNMGDGGTCVGAVLAFLLEHDGLNSRAWETCYLGPEFTEGQMQAAIEQAGMEATRFTSVASDIAKVLAGGKVVGRFAGAMEYGPRALGNRSILCSASDPEINNWLNQRLGRTEFMPFAPVTLFEHCRERSSTRGCSSAWSASRRATVFRSSILLRRSPSAATPRTRVGRTTRTGARPATAGRPR